MLEPIHKTKILMSSARYKEKLLMKLYPNNLKDFKMIFKVRTLLLKSDNKILENLLIFKIRKCTLENKMGIINSK